MKPIDALLKERVPAKIKYFEEVEDVPGLPVTKIPFYSQPPLLPQINGSRRIGGGSMDGLRMHPAGSGSASHARGAFPEAFVSAGLQTAADADVPQVVEDMPSSEPTAFSLWTNESFSDPQDRATDAADAAKNALHWLHASGDAGPGAAG